MCNQTTYKLPCEHVRTLTTYCPSAPSPKKDHDHQNRKTCKTITHTNASYPPPADVDPRTIPNCPLPNCPYEVRNRCWNCCWCGKAWNVGGRCSCVMIIDGNEYRCEHFCCATCEAARE